MRGLPTPFHAMPLGMSTSMRSASAHGATISTRGRSWVASFRGHWSMSAPHPESHTLEGSSMSDADQRAAQASAAQVFSGLTADEIEVLAQADRFAHNELYPLA